MPENANTGPGPEEEDGLTAYQMATLLKWLCSQMQQSFKGHDGGWWSLPVATFTGIRTDTALDAIKQAYERS